MDDLSLQQLLVTNFGLSPSGYTGSIGAVGATGPAGGYTGSAGSVGYVGSVGGGVVMTVDTFTGDGTTTAFVLTTTPESINRTTVNYNGVTVLRSAYTLSQATITFSSAPAAGSQIEITTINSAAGSGSGGTALKITTIGYVGNNTATNTAGGETITLTGTGYISGASVLINGIASGVVTVVNDTQLTFSAPALAAGTYILYVVNPDGATAISVPGISYSGVPSFYVGAGSVGTVYEAGSFNSNVAAVGDSAITYTIASGTLPTGATLNANGVITGSSVLTASPTTYTFGVTASDGQNQDVVRSYTITVNPDTVTWSAPADAATVTLGQGSSSTTTLTAVSAAGSAVTYTANALPTGLSIVGSAVTGTPTVLGNTTALLTATATSTTRSADITVVWNVAVTNEPYFMYNSLLLSGNGTNNATNNTFVDSSTNNFAVTRAGNTTQGTFSPYGANWSNYLGGAGNYFQTPASSASTIVGTLSSTANLTIECWIYPTAYNSSANFPGLIGDMVATSENNNWSWGITNTGTLMLYWYAGAQLRATSSNAVLLNTWTHIALNVAAGAITMYINGVSQTLSGTTTLGTAGSNGYLVIGQWNNGSGGTNGTSHGLYTGYISNLRVVKASTYTSNFTPSTTPLTAIANTSLLYCQSNRFKDNSTNNLAITVGGTPTIQRFSPFSPASVTPASYGAYFDGASDYIRKAGAGVLTASGDVTIECWIYPLSSSVVGLFDGGPNEEDIMRNWPANRIGKVGGSNNPTFTVTSNTWQHFACTFGGGNIKVFINGSLNASGTYAGGYAAGSNFDIGTINAGGDGSFNGYISNFRVTKSILYTTTFTPSTTPLTAIANTSLLTLQSTRFIDNSANNYTLTSVGNSQPSQQNPFGFTSALTNSYSAGTIGGSGYFDGNGDYLSAPSSTAFAFPSGVDFTAEGWVYLTSYGPGNIVGGALIGTTNGSTTGWFINLGQDINTLRITSNATGTWADNITVTTGNGVPLNTWTHIAFVRNGGSLVLYKNGVSVGSMSGASAYNFTSPNNSAYIGYISDGTYTRYVTGNISDVRVVKGTAVYTSAFTPPTAPVTAITNTSLLLNYTNAGIIDSTMINNLETVGDAKISTAQSKFGGSSMVFDGTGDYCFLPNTQAFLFSGSDFTIELWVYISDTSARKYVIGPGFDNASHYKGFGVEIWGQQLSVWASSNGTGWNMIECDTAANRGSTLLSANTWYHIAVSRSGNTIRSFVNGVVEKTYTVSGAIFSDATIPYNIGRVAYSGGTFYFNGYLDDLRITKGYARYTANFTPPASAFSQK